jgi:hypothetical protein
LIDGSRHTRWHSGDAGQTGEELLQIRFRTPTKIRGVELDPGEYTTDFPRGLLIRGGSCDESQAKTFAFYPSWQGALSFTPLGFPFFAGQDAVRVFFDHEELIECLFIRQTSKSSFNWSVAEFRVTP